MIKIAYNFITKGPLHTGSDVTVGTLRTFRRQKSNLANPIIYESRLTEEQRRDAVVQIALGIWYSIPWDNIKGPRLMGIYDEFNNKFVAAARAGNKFKFLEILCRSWGIESLRNKNLLKALELLNDQELLDTIRNESIYIMLKIRIVNEERKARKEIDKNLEYMTPEQIEALSEPILSEIIPGESYQVIRSTDDIPCVIGNSIRGKMRRLIMVDFWKRVGIILLQKSVYHMFLTGGNLNQSTQFENIDKMENFIKNCPALGVLGSAIGNMTIKGEGQIGCAYPLCRERGTSERSYWEYLDTIFQTRLDSSKLEKEIEFINDTAKLEKTDEAKEVEGEKKDKKRSSAQQMKYEYEVIADGTPFEHRIVCTSEQPLIISAFWHMLSLFTNRPYVGGRGAVGCGEIMPDQGLLAQKPDGAESVYLNYLEEHKDGIKKFWEEMRL